MLHDHEEALPLTLLPMLATPGPLPEGDDWIYEIKWDGVRALVAHDRRQPETLRIWSRRGNVVTHSYPELAPLAEVLRDHDVVLDGEIVAFDDAGRPSFNRIQERLGVGAADAVLRARANPVVLVVFDLLHLDGLSTRALPWSSRRSLLEQLGLDSGPHWRISSVHTDGAALHEATLAADLEGVVAKRIDSRYLPAQRSVGWVKVKNMTVDEFVIGGWVPGSGRRETSIGSLLLGIPIGDEADAPLRWVGRVGTGFTDAELDRLQALLGPHRTTRSPFVNDLREPKAVFVASRKRCKVEYREITRDGILRFPSYRGLIGSADDVPDSVSEHEEEL